MMNEKKKRDGKDGCDDDDERQMNRNARNTLAALRRGELLRVKQGG